MAASVKNEELETAIKNILKDADLDSLSAKKVRRKLEEMFEIDFTERKKEIDEITMKLITSATDKEEVTEPKSKPSLKSKAGNVTQNGSKKNVDNVDHESGDCSDASDVLDTSSASKKTKLATKTKVEAKAKRGDVRKKKQTEKTSDSDSSDEVDDAQLAKQLQQEEDRNLRTRRRPNKKPPAPRKAKSDKEKKERKGKSMYSRPCQLSADLAEVIGTDQMSRHEIVKRMWEIMRERDLQDQKNKQFMICDPQLQKVFGRKRVRMFGMMKHLTKHIRSVNDDIVE